MNKAHLEICSSPEWARQVDPGTLEARLLAAGFARARVEVAGDRLKFAATAGPSSPAGSAAR